MGVRLRTVSLQHLMAGRAVAGVVVAPVPHFGAVVHGLAVAGSKALGWCPVVAVAVRVYGTTRRGLFPLA